MRIFLSPIRLDSTINYTFEGEIITAVMDGQADTFDFSAMTDGKASDITTTLPFSPIISAEKESGVLSVILLNPIGEDATEQEKFPEWTVV